MIDSNVDFPTDGNPTKPTSAISLSSRVRLRSSPGSPFSAISGAGFDGVAKRQLPRPPRPPRATITSCSCSTRSASTSPVSVSRITVPGGTFRYKSFDLRPCIPLLIPFSPFGATNFF